jgi:Ca2+-transporting ATPase
LIFIFGVLENQDILQIFLTSVAVAVAAVPEGLLVAITIILALGMQRILKKQGLIRKMSVAETLGSTSIILTDKTGTLTMGKMGVSGIYTVDEKLLSRDGSYLKNINENKKEFRACFLALKISVLCSEAFVENLDRPKKEWLVRGRLTDRAMLLAGFQAGITKEDLEKEEPSIKGFSFNSLYKYSASLHKTGENKNTLYLTGAPEVVLKNSKFFYSEGKEKKMDEKTLDFLSNKLETLTKKGQRVLALSYKNISEKEILKTEDANLVTNLVFVGLMSLSDPIRKEVKDAIRTCKMAGMRPIIVTGDHKFTAKAIASELGIPVKKENIIEGKDLAIMEEDEFRTKIFNYNVYARVEPSQKLRIAKAWQNKGQVVAMTGDGVNDALALKMADIGVALGSGTDVAKEASDLILLNDNFSVIVSAVEEGRRILDNIRKVVTYFLSDSFTEVILIGVSIFAKLPLPVLAAQILWVNLIEDSLPALGLSFEEKEKDVMKRKPESQKTSILNKEMKVLIFAIGIFTDLLLLGLFVWLLNRGVPIQEIRTIIFANLAISSLFYVFSCKNLKKNFWKINIFDNKILLAGWFWGMGMLLLAIYFPPLQDLLKTQPLGFFDWTLITLLGIINLIFIEGTKYFFNKNK